MMEIEILFQSVYCALKVESCHQEYHTGHRLLKLVHDNGPAAKWRSVITVEKLFPFLQQQVSLLHVANQLVTCTSGLIKFTDSQLSCQQLLIFIASSKFRHAKKTCLIYSWLVTQVIQLAIAIAMIASQLVCTQYIFNIVVYSLAISKITIKFFCSLLYKPLAMLILNAGKKMQVRLIIDVIPLCTIEQQTQACSSCHTLRMTSYL